MGNKQESSNIHSLLVRRSKEYGQAWLVAGQLIWYLRVKGLLQQLDETPYMHNFVLILSKLARILKSPSNIDHWKDIAGYATLIVEHLEEGAPTPDDIDTKKEHEEFLSNVDPAIVDALVRQAEGIAKRVPERRSDV